MMLLPIVANASDFDVDGIAYNFILVSNKSVFVSKIISGVDGVICQFGNYNGNNLCEAERFFERNIKKSK